MLVEGLVLAWTTRARKLREWAAAEEAAKAWEAAANELDATLTETEQELLNLQQAAQRSGYSSDHLGRLVREGKIANAGRQHAPRIKTGDLPRKPGRVSDDGMTEHAVASKEFIARSFLSAAKGEDGGRAA